MDTCVGSTDSDGDDDGDDEEEHESQSNRMEENRSNRNPSFPSAVAIDSARKLGGFCLYKRERDKSDGRNAVSFQEMSGYRCISATSLAVLFCPNSPHQTNSVRSCVLTIGP
ncbi:hypothetical protein NL676_032861 [Syzygium grande]|nr:hypothetical protein NL676_032861 [Syzygium grande]